MKLNVKEIFGPTIQGEGSFTGWPAIFIRFAGCNMWSGKLEDKSLSGCPYCDTDFLKGTLHTPATIASKVNELARGKSYLIVVTGGEPLLQPIGPLRDLILLLKKSGHRTQVETNGTVDSLILREFDYVVCSPKVDFDRLNIPKEKVDCWKILYPHPTVTLDSFIEYAETRTHQSGRVAYFYIQPITIYEPNTFNSSAAQGNLDSAIRKVQSLGLPWKLSLQTHKMIGVQ